MLFRTVLDFVAKGLSMLAMLELKLHMLPDFVAKR
jgi:hypothetical protein